MTEIEVLFYMTIEFYDLSQDCIVMLTVNRCHFNERQYRGVTWIHDFTSDFLDIMGKIIINRITPLICYTFQDLSNYLYANNPSCVGLTIWLTHLPSIRSQSIWGLSAKYLYWQKQTFFITSLTFIPQLTLSEVMIPLTLIDKDLATIMFAQTFVFVTFNKVCIL